MAALYRLADLVDDPAEELGRCDTWDIGKPISRPVGTDVPRSAVNLRFFADFARRAVDEALPFSGRHHGSSEAGAPACGAGVSGR